MLGLMVLAAAAATPCADTSTAAGLRAVDAGAVACDVPEERIEPRLRASTPAETARVRQYFNDGLKDAPTARWQWLGTWRGGWICGKLNAKNSFGAYTGWQVFAYRNGIAFMEDDGRQPWQLEERVPCMLPALVSWKDIRR